MPDQDDENRPLTPQEEEAVRRQGERLERETQTPRGSR